VESVGVLSASATHVTQAAVHSTTDLTPSFGAVEAADDSASTTVTTTTRTADAGGDAAELPEVAPKDQGLKTGEAR
jgi:hypothetical protein